MVTKLAEEGSCRRLGELSEDLKQGSECSARCQVDAYSSGVKAGRGVCPHCCDTGRVQPEPAGMLCNILGEAAQQLPYAGVEAPAPGVWCARVWVWWGCCFME